MLEFLVPGLSCAEEAVVCCVKEALTKIRSREGRAVEGKVKCVGPRWCCHMSVIKYFTSLSYIMQFLWVRVG